MVSIIYEVEGAPATVYCNKTDTKPITGIVNGSALIFVDDQSAGVMFFDGDKQAWIDKDGVAWIQ